MEGMYGKKVQLDLTVMSNPPVMVQSQVTRRPPLLEKDTCGQ
jgi:hypothetical protein